MRLPLLAARHATRVPSPAMNVSASLAKRLAAGVYDLLPLIGLWMATTALVLFAFGVQTDVAHPSPAYRIALQLALLAVTGGYFCASWVRGGQTIGMRAWRLRVVSVEGGALAWPRSLLRFLVALASVAALGLGFLWCLIDREGRAWHDIAARSRVISVPRLQSP